MQRYFIKEKQINNSVITISNQDLHHIKNVMRFKLGDDVIVITDNLKTYKASIAEYTKSSVLLDIVEEIDSIDNTLNVTLAQSLIKKDKFE